MAGPFAMTRPSGFTNEEFNRTDPSEDLVNVVVDSFMR